jgi:prepilin-type processing-associated H-X9-DG protein
MRRIHGQVAALVMILTISGDFARCQDPGTKVAGAGSAVAPLARAVPRQDLFIYLEFHGLDAHADAWHKTAAYRLLEETKLGTLLEDLAVQAIEAYQATMPSKVHLKGVDLVDAVKRIARNGFVFAVSGKPPGKSQYIVILRRGDRAEIKQLLESLNPSRAGEADEMAEVGPVQKAGRTLHRLGAEGVWWSEKGDLILTATSKVDEILEVLQGRQQSALDHPLRPLVTGAEQSFELVAAGFLDAGALEPLSSSAMDLGLGGLKRIELRWGFDADALVSLVRVVAPAPRPGAFALLDQPTFGIGALPPIPAGVSGLTVISIDLAKSYDKLDALVKLVGPPGTMGLATPVIMAQQGLQLRRDLLAHLGPTLAFYTQSHLRDDSESVAALMASRAAGTTFSAQLQQRDTVARAIDPLMRGFGPLMRQTFRPVARDRLAMIAASLSFHRENGRVARYTIDWPANTLPPPFSTMLRPTVVVGQNEVVLAASKEAAEAALAAGPRWQPGEAFAPIVRQLPPEMVYLRLGDPRPAIPVLLRMLPVLVRQVNAEISLEERRAGRIPKDVYVRLDPDTLPSIDELNRRLFPSSTTVTVDGQGALLSHRQAMPTISSPAATGAMVAYFIPALQASLDAARRVQCVNNLKQLALAMHNYHSANNAFPRAASRDEKGKPLLSWRVSILPYLGHQALYNKFNLDEPWDSAHNMPLLSEMPPMYSCPNRVKPEPFTTNYQVFVGKNAMFEPDQDIGVADVTDGTSNTLMIVEARTGVPWTKPDDLSFDPAAAPSLSGAGSPHAGGFNAAMGDGSVRFIKNSIDLKIFRILISRNLGEVVSADSF